MAPHSVEIPMSRSHDRDASQRSRIAISPSLLPIGETSIFKDSSFFRKHGPDSNLPSPTEVRGQLPMTDKSGSRTVSFPSLGLVVKYGVRVTIAEGQCLWTIKHFLGDAVPVPEVYGWRTDGEEVFLYMERIQGATLEECWGSLNTTQRHDVCQQLRDILNSLHMLQQDSGPFVGAIGRQHLEDIVFPQDELAFAGPFGSVKEFHDWYSQLYRHRVAKLNGFVHSGAATDPYRSNLPDHVPIQFTHGDLHRSNIIVSLGDKPCIAAIIDWHQSGWLPAYWEYFKATFTANFKDEWFTTYIPTFLDEIEEDCEDAVWFYARSLGY